MDKIAGMVADGWIISVIIVAALIAVAVMIYRNVSKAKESREVEYRTVWDVINGVKAEMKGILREDIKVGTTGEEFERKYKRKATWSTVLKEAAYGKPAAVNILTQYIRTFIDNNLTDAQVSEILGFTDFSEPSPYVKFVALMLHYMKKKGSGALADWVNEYSFDVEKEGTDGNGKLYISTPEMTDSYSRELKKAKGKMVLDAAFQREILAELVFEPYRGFGVITLLTRMDIDGINFGTSGYLIKNADGNIGAGNEESEATNYLRSCWIYLHGKYIHLRFIDFGNENEMKRIISSIIRYNNKGSLTEKHAMVITTMADKTRVLAIRPGTGEAYGCWLRRFTLKNVSAQNLFNPHNDIKGVEMLEGMLKAIMRGEQNCLTTGRQGSGKTTLLMLMLQYIVNRYNLRLLESTFELYMREMMPDRNIFSSQITRYSSVDDIKAAYRKSDAGATTLGELSDCSLTAAWIELTQTSVITTGSYHGIDTEETVYGLRNDAVNAKMFADADAALQQILKALRFDIHMDYNASGERFVESINEVVKLNIDNYPEFTMTAPKRSDYNTDEEFDVAYKEFDAAAKEHEIKLNTEHYRRLTDRKAFTVRKILHYDTEKREYAADEKPTDGVIKEMLSKMSKKDATEFKQLLSVYWDLGDIDSLETIDVENYADIEEVSDSEIDELLANTTELQVSREQDTLMIDAIIDEAQAEHNENDKLFDAPKSNDDAEEDKMLQEMLDSVYAPIKWR